MLFKLRCPQKIQRRSAEAKDAADDVIKVRKNHVERLRGETGRIRTQKISSPVGHV